MRGVERGSCLNPPIEQMLRNSESVSEGVGLGGRGSCRAGFSRVSGSAGASPSHFQNRLLLEEADEIVLLEVPPYFFFCPVPGSSKSRVLFPSLTSRTRVLWSLYSRGV